MTFNQIDHCLAVGQVLIDYAALARIIHELTVVDREEAGEQTPQASVRRKFGGSAFP